MSKQGAKGSVDTDQEDVEFYHSWAQMIARTGIIKESKLVQMVDELDLWCDVGGSLGENDERIRETSVEGSD